jgi:hypothetical protein
MAGGVTRILRYVILANHSQDRLITPEIPFGPLYVSYASVLGAGRNTSDWRLNRKLLLDDSALRFLAVPVVSSFQTA